MTKRILWTSIACLFFPDLGFAEELRDVRPPVALPPNFFILFLLLFPVLVVFLILLIRFLSRRMKRKPKEKPVVRQKPWEAAYKKLEELRNKNLPAKGRIKEFYSCLSDIIRVYIEGRFCINAPDMTTEEFLSSLRLTQALKASQKEALGEFLNCCDMVKFAKYSSNEQEVEHSFETTKRFIDETKEETG